MGVETDGVVGERAKGRKGRRVILSVIGPLGPGRIAGDEMRAYDVEMLNAGCHLPANSVVVIPPGWL